MPKAKTNIDFESLNSTLKELQTALPNDSEISRTFLSTLDSITKLTKNHDELISKYYSDFEVSTGTKAGDLKEINNAYTGLVNGIATAVGQSGIDESGSVDNKGNSNTTSSSTYSKSNGSPSTTTSKSSSPAPTVQSGGLNSSNTPKVRANNNTSTSKSSKNTTKTNTKTTTKSTPTPSATIAKQKTNKINTTSGLPRNVTSTASSIGSAVKIPLPSVKSNNYKNKIALGSAVGGTVVSTAATTIGGSIVTEPSQNYQLSTSFWSSIDSTEKDAIINKLEEVGYSSSEIKDIQDNKIGIPEDVLDSVHKIITEKTKKDSGIRNTLKNNYGFDMFDDDKTVNKDKLSLALIVDQKDESDIYDLNQTLNIKESATSNDSLLENVIKPSETLKVPVKNSSTGGATVASILLGTLGISGGGAAIAIKRKKKKNKEKQENTEENNI